MGKPRLEIEFVRSEFEKCGYKLLTAVYVNCYQKLKYICPKGHAHSIQWTSWQQGHRCPYCAGQGKPDISYIRDFFAKSGYRLLSNVYVNSESKLRYRCPEGHLHNMSWNNFRRGKRCPECGIIKQALQVTGSNHYNWKGGVTTFNKELRNFVKHIGWVDKIFKRDNYTCKFCDKKGGYLIAHHIIPLSFIREKFNITTIKKAKKCEILYDTDYGVTLCKKCHKKIHDKFYIRRNLVLCLKKELMELSNGLYEPFMREILCRNPSNCWEALSDNAEGNQQRSPETGTFND